jgi:hypothetical protein
VHARTIVKMALGAMTMVLGLVIAPVFMASAASAAPAGGAYTCTGGNIAPGTYTSILVTGVCYMPAGTIVVSGNLTVAPKALLDAVSPGDPPSHPVVPATVLIGGNVVVGKGAVLVLGCSPNISCSSPPGISFDRIGGNLTATGALGVVVHSATIAGSASVLGGGGGAAGGPGSGKCFTVPIPAPWSEDTTLINDGSAPQFTDFEDNSIGGSLTVAGMRTCWLGSFRNLVGGSITFTNDATSDPDGMEIDNNLVHGNLTCLSNDPAVQFGDSGAAPNLVGGLASGQCGFDVVLPNPAPEAMQGPGIPEHIAVSTGSLNYYIGTHTSTHVISLPPTKTESGYIITANLNNFRINGAGLAGSGTVNPQAPPGSSGEAFLATVYPKNLSESFIAYDTCNCRFLGQAGTIAIRFYGTTGGGFTHGIFLVVSGGTGHGGLGTLAGWGTFASFGPVWLLTEHLRIT